MPKGWEAICVRSWGYQRSLRDPLASDSVGLPCSQIESIDTADGRSAALAPRPTDRQPGLDTMRLPRPDELKPPQQVNANDLKGCSEQQLEHSLPALHDLLACQ